jgi:hypothetical protein
MFQPLVDLASNLFATLISEWAGDMIGAVIVLVAIVIGVIRWHRNQRAAKKLGMASLPFIVACFVFALIAIGGGAFGLGLRMSAVPVTAPITRPDTRLRLRLDPAGTKNYLQESESNIGNWQQTIVAIGAEDKDNNKTTVLHTDTFAMTFTEPVDYERPIIDSFGHKLGGYNYYSLGTRGAMFQFYDAVQAPVIEIWFPPPGYYANRAKGEQQK